MSTSLPSNYIELLTGRLSTLPEVRLGYLFGTRASDHARPTSDLDIAVLVDGRHAAGPKEINRTVRRLASRLSGEISSTLLDIVLLNNAPVLLRHRVPRDGQLLFARDEVTRVRCQ